MTITVSCPSCSTSFPVDPRKIPEGGVNARCSSCGSVFFVEKPAQFEEPAAAAPTPDEVRAAPEERRAPAPPATTPAPDVDRHGEVAPPAEPRAPTPEVEEHEAWTGPAEPSRTPAREPGQEAGGPPAQPDVAPSGTDVAGTGPATEEPGMPAEAPPEETAPRDAPAQESASREAAPAETSPEEEGRPAPPEWEEVQWERADAPPAAEAEEGVETAWDAGGEVPAEDDEAVTGIPEDAWVIEREPGIDSTETLPTEALDTVESSQEPDAPTLDGIERGAPPSMAWDQEPPSEAGQPTDAAAESAAEERREAAGVDDEGWPEVDLDMGEPPAEEEPEPLVTGGFEGGDFGSPDLPSAEVEETVEQEPTAEAAPPAEPQEPEAGRAPETLSAPAETPQGFQFGKRDPHEKARRLARVLVSDMIMYNPERHSRALDQGTLEADFDDEIRKSWEEYVNQVGRDLARETSYFTDALNDILARGREVFHGSPGQ